VVVIGGGAAGLFAAHRLLCRGADVTLCEAAPQTGGLLGYTQVGNTPLERFYHHMFINDVFLLDTLAHVGIPVDWSYTKTGFIGPGPTPIREFSSPHHLLTFPGLSARERVSLLSALARTSLAWVRWGGDVAALDDVTIEEWMSRWGGGPAYKAFFEPLIRKKFGSDTPRISAAWMVGRLGMRSKRTSEGERLGYPRGSYRALTLALERECRERGGDIRCNEPVRGLELENGRVKAVRTVNNTFEADAVISTMQPVNQARLMRSAGFERAAEAMDKVPYQGAMVALLGLERSISDFYWVNIIDSQAPFGAMIEHTLFRPVQEYGGTTVYLASYPDPDDPMWDMEDEAIIEHMLNHLRRLFPRTMANNGLRWSELGRTRQAGLLYHAGLKRLLPPWRTPVPGMFVTGMFRTYPKRPIDLIGADASACADVAFAELRGWGAPPWTDTKLPRTLLP